MEFRRKTREERTEGNTVVDTRSNRGQNVDVVEEKRTVR